MKVELIKEWVNGVTAYPIGTVVSLDDWLGRQLIAEGVACEAPDDARPFLGTGVVTQCVPTEPTVEKKNKKVENPD